MTRLRRLASLILPHSFLSAHDFLVLRLLLEIKLVSNPYVRRRGIFFLICSSRFSCSALSFLLIAPLLYFRRIWPEFVMSAFQ